MTVRIQTEDFDVGAETAAMRKDNPSIGAIASFVGVVRDVNEGDAVSEMTLEHYPGMTERSIDEIIGKRERGGTSSMRSSCTALACSSPRIKSCWSSSPARIAATPLRLASSSWITSRPERHSGRKSAPAKVRVGWMRARRGRHRG